MKVRGEREEGRKVCESVRGERRRGLLRERKCEEVRSRKRGRKHVKVEGKRREITQCPSPPPHTHTHTHTHTQNEQLQRTNWQLVDENHRLNVRLMEDDKSSFLSRRPGDGGSEEASARSSYASELGFQRNTQLRQTYHFGEAPRKAFQPHSQAPSTSGFVPCSTDFFKWVNFFTCVNIR